MCNRNEKSEECLRALFSQTASCALLKLTASLRRKLWKKSMTNKPNYKYFAALPKVAYSYLKLLIKTFAS